MKNIFTLLLVLSVFTISAQKIEFPEASKAIASCHPTMLPPIPCGGVARIKSIDLDWQPLLVKKPANAKLLSAGANLDSIKAAQWLLKQEYEKSGVKTAAKTTSDAPIVATNFAGTPSDGSSPLDNSIAVSNAGIILSVENSTIYGHNVSGTPLFTANLATFLPFTGVYDVSNPVVLYDPTKDRFILVCQEINATGLFSNNRMFVCFSQTNNPATGGWWCYSFTGDPTLTGNAFDHARVGINDSEIFISGNLYYEPSNTFNKAMLFQIDKLAGFAGTPLTSVYYNTLFGSPFTLTPVSYGQGSNLTTGMLLISTVPGGGSNINLYSISGYVTATPTMTYYSITTPVYTPPANAMQLGTTTTLNTGDCRAQSAFFLDGIIHFVFNCSSGGYTGINYNRLTVATLTNVSSTYTETGFDCAYPAVASFATSATNRNVMIGFARSGSTITPEIRVVNCDNAMSWSTSTLVKTGAYVAYTGTTARWGDYSGMARHHTSTTPSVWMNGAYGNIIHKWTTWVAQIDTGSLAPCPSPTGLTATSITATSVVLGWTSVPGALSYSIRYRKVGTTTWSTTTATGTATSKTITGLTSSTNYEYEVQTMCTVSSGSTYATAPNFTTLVGAYVALLSYKDGRIYPNPVVDVFHIEFPLSEACKLNISVMDMSGKVVKELYNAYTSAGNNEFSFNKANLAPGNYVLIIRANDETIRNEKIVIAE